MSERQKTYIVMHSKGEVINGLKVRPYEEFKSVPTDYFTDKVKKGFLIEKGAPKASQRASARKTNKKK